MIRTLIHFLGSPLIHLTDGGFISWGWAMAVAASWMLIPGAYLLRSAELRNRRKVFAATQPTIDAGIAHLRELAKDAERRAPESAESRFLRGTLAGLTSGKDGQNAV